MKEQIMIFFSTWNDGMILDYSRNGEVAEDIEEGGCHNTSDLLLTPPNEDNIYGLWIWEGLIGFNQLLENIEYIGDYRMLTPEEIVLLVRGLRVVDDVPEAKTLSPMAN